MSWIKTGGEFLINTTTTGNQFGAIATRLTGGGFIVNWQDASGTGNVRGQIYDGSGTKVGTELLINTTDTSDQGDSFAAEIPGVGFMVIWSDLSASGGDTSSWATRGQLFDGSGTKVNSEFLVNTTVNGYQVAARIAQLPPGGAVVTWYDQNPDLGEIVGQRYGSNGAKIGGEFAINTTTTGIQLLPRVAAFSDGGFVVAWTDQSTTGGDTSGDAIRGQRFDSNFGKIGGEFLVNTTTTANQTGANVAVLANGGFVVTWDDASATGTDTSGTAVRGQIYDAAGAKVGGEFVVNSTTSGDQSAGYVTALSTGGFVVTWWDQSATGLDTSGDAARGQFYSNSGVKIGGEFLINTTTVGNQARPRATELAPNKIVITFEDSSTLLGDGSLNGVIGQIFEFNPNLFLLTATPDAITGTSSADTIRGAAADLQVGDALDGGAGIDTFELVAAATLDLRVPGGFTSIERLRGTAGVDWVILDASRGVSTIEGGAGSDGVELVGANFDLSALGITFIDIEEVFMAEAGSTMLVVHPADIAAITKFGANPVADTGVDSLATPATVLDLTGKTLSNIDQLQSISTSGTAITPPVGWVGTITGGAGNDTVTLDHANASSVVGGAGNDALVLTGAGALTLPATTDIEAVVYAGATGQSITLAASEVRIIAFGTGDDTIAGGLNPDQVFLGSGNDSFTGDLGNDLAIGEAGSDTVRGGQGADTLFGGTLGSLLDGGSDPDTLCGGNGDDTILGGSDVVGNLIFGGAGNDSITGAGILVAGAGADTVVGNSGADTLFGVSGANVLNGASGDDIVRGGDDAETIIGGLGNDTLWGGGGADQFNLLPGDGLDVIADFAVGSDTIDLTALGITTSTFATLSQTSATNGIILILSSTQSISLIGVTTLGISDVVVV